MKVPVSSKKTEYMSELDQRKRASLISLFCGPGGMDEGFRQAGFVTRLAYDISEHCAATLRHNHGCASAHVVDLSEDSPRRIVDDWCRVSAEPPVGVIGGPPCQSFSISNAHKTIDDPRDTLPGRYALLIDELNEVFGLDFFVFENVPGLLDARHVGLYEKFKSRARQAGFYVSEKELDAENYGVPQRRKRIFVVGLNRSKYRDRFDFPEATDKTVLTVRDAIGDLNEPVLYNSKLTPDKIRDKTGHPNHWCMRPKSDKFDPDNDFLEPGVIKGRSFRTLAWHEPSFTVAYGNREVHVHPECHRRLSVFEAMRLQDFPDHYELIGNMSQQIDMVSDAVPPSVAKAIGEAIFQQTNLNAMSFPISKATD